MALEEIKGKFQKHFGNIMKYICVHKHISKANNVDAEILEFSIHSLST